MAPLSCRQNLLNILKSGALLVAQNTPYYPTGNSQVERFSGIVWNTVRFALASAKLSVEQWESACQIYFIPFDHCFLLPEMQLHMADVQFSKTIQSRNIAGLLPGSVLLRKCTRSNKQDDVVEEVEHTFGIKMDVI